MLFLISAILSYPVYQGIFKMRGNVVKPVVFVPVMCVHFLLTAFVAGVMK